MRLLLLALIVVVLQPTFAHAEAVGSSGADADQTSASHIDANIYRGDASISGGFSLAYSTYSKTIFSVFPSAEFFIADRFSIGGSGQYFIDAFQTQYSIGPSASYYFWTHRHVASFARLGVLYSHTNADVVSQNSFRLDPALGFLYFPVRFISFGPTLTVSIPLDHDSREYDSSPHVSLLADFGLYF